MAQFVVIGRDATDDKALERRMTARDAHLNLVNAGIPEGRFLMGAALTDAEGRMIGSMMLVDFPSRAELYAWLKVEPYVTGGVWSDIEIIPAKVAPGFVEFLPKKKAA